MSVRVGLGLASFPFSGAAAFRRWVERCEASAIDSLWQTDRLASRDGYLESLAAMAAIAGATSRIKFGMNAVVASFRDPLVLAKQCATIDFLSGGRLLPVFGVGAEHAPEWRAAGLDARSRGARADEILEIARRLWSEGRADFEGRFFRYRDASIAPRPVQQPLPLWIGGMSAAAVRRTARLGTGWLGGIAAPEQVAPVIEAIRKELAATGRHIEPDHFGATLPFRFGSWDEPLVHRVAAAQAALATPAIDPRRVIAVGDAAAVVERIREYQAAGAAKFVLIPIARGDSEVMAHTERVAAEVVPAVHD